MIITSENNYKGLDEWLQDKKKVLLVCGKSADSLEGLGKKLKEVKTPIVRFSDFQPNPLYESVVKGVAVFRAEGCDSVIAVGGGSAMDVAKCIKLYFDYPGDGVDGSWLMGSELKDEMSGGRGAAIPFLAVPTTAGTGSEATRFAVIYYGGKKQSVTSSGIIPDTVLMDPNVLKTLPSYQRKATMCDALCHAIESCWSVNSTEESKEYAKEAIRGIMKYMDAYLANTDAGNAGMLNASYLAGKAINVTQTTAGHAMCYKITGLFGVSHGHAAMLCNRVLYPWMIKNIHKCIDPRGPEYLRATLDEIGVALGCNDAGGGAKKLKDIFERLELSVPKADDEQFEELVRSVNPDRLKNHPAELDEKCLAVLYHEILE